MGDNPRNVSYMIGFGENYPTQPHHRGSSGNSAFGDPNEFVLYGAMVAGPKSANDFDYNDNRNDFIGNEVALGYNSPLTSALIQAYDDFGGDPLTDIQLNNLPEITTGIAEFRTITGTGDGERLFGGLSTELIFGLRGNDTIAGGKNQDIIYGG